MADIISFKKKDDQAFDICMEKFHAASSELMENPREKNAGKVFQTMSETIREVFKDTDWKGQQEIADKHAAAFVKKYKAAYAFMPKNAKDKIAYLAKVMLSFVPGMFHGENEGERRLAFFDYGDFLYTELEPAAHEFEDLFKERGKTVPFPEFEAEEENGLEDAVRKCLEAIVLLSEEGEGKEAELLKALRRIFYLDAALTREMTG